MKFKLIFCFAFVLSSDAVFALVDGVQLLPGKNDEPVSIQVSAGNFGEHFSVYYKTNATTWDKFLHANLEISDNDRRIAICAVEKNWTTNGVRFEFTVSAPELNASRFTIIEEGHVREEPMPDATFYWFYLRDFATNNLSTKTQITDSGIPLAIIKALPHQMQTLHPGMSADDVWKHLNLKAYQNKLGGEASPEHEKWWLAWNYELELNFEEPPTNQPFFDRGKRKLIQATLYKNGKEICRSNK